MKSSSTSYFKLIIGPEKIFKSNRHEKIDLRIFTKSKVSGEPAPSHSLPRSFVVCFTSGKP